MLEENKSMERSGDHFSSKVSLNLATNILRTVIMALAGLLMVPYYIGEFGLAAYATIPLAVSMTAYFIAISDSIASSFTRYMVMTIQEDDAVGVNKVYSTSIVGLSRVMMILVPIVIVLSLLSPYVFNIGPAGALDVQLMFLMVILSALIISFSSCIASVFMAYNRLYVTYSSRIVQALLQVGSVVVFLNVMEPSLTSVGISYLFSSLVFIAIMMIYLRRSYPNIRFSHRLYDATLLKDMGTVGLWTMIAELGTLLFIQASVVMVNIGVGSQAQAEFSIISNLISMINTACMAVAVTCVPLVYKSYAEGRIDAMVRDVRLFSKFIGLSMALPMAYLMIFAPQVLGVWLGPGYGGLVPLICLMIPAELCVCTSSVMMQVPIAFKKVRKIAAVTVLMGSLNVLIAYVLLSVTELGVYGVGISWVVTIMVLRAIIYPYYVSRLTKSSFWGMLSGSVYSYVALAALLVVFWMISTVVTLPTTWLAVILSILSIFSIYLIFIMKFVFNSDERGLLIKFMPISLQKSFGRFLS